MESPLCGYPLGQKNDMSLQRVFIGTNTIRNSVYQIYPNPVRKLTNKILLFVKINSKSFLDGVSFHLYIVIFNLECFVLEVQFNLPLLYTK